MVKNKWNKLVGRNQYPLHWSAMLKQIHEGIEIADLYWRGRKFLAIKYNSPLMYSFLYKNSSYETNFEKKIQEVSLEVDDALNEAINFIETSLKLKPRKEIKNIEKLYIAFKYNGGLMALGYYWSNNVLTYIENKVGDRIFQKIKNEASTPHKKTLLVREHNEISKNSTLYHNKKIDIDKLKNIAERLEKKYGFIHSEYKSKPWTANDYLKEIRRKHDIEEENHEKSYKKDRYISWLISIARKCSYIYDEGKSAVVRSNWALRNTLKNCGLKEEMILNLSEDEFNNWLKSGQLPSSKTLKQRDKFHLIKLWNSRYVEFFEKNKIEEIIKREHITEFISVKGIKRLTGTVAYSGKVRGRAKIIFSQKDANELKPGSILIASMTTPEHIIGMRRAIAFVTDEGGILCHAAIIAREMKKPCIIGTKNATKVIRNNDLIEVDAGKGVVKIIKKAEK